MILSVSDLFVAVGAVPKLIASFEQAKRDGDHAGALATIAREVPQVLPIIEKVANYIYPGAGTGIEVMAWVLQNSRPMSPAEQQIWFDRQTPQG
jgi:hypothetical protein